ncbi:hypothetical protein PVAP13_5KG370600 [Panicum virgatum]|uniref:Uncharacterized protein n=1 Tax=Panicum virgatum TaxID=38727 RepID=A0A8T0SIX8_PANVG|nr:hypothetical protein PVAP13_5KG370600 [Panicum virgatum]
MLGDALHGIVLWRKADIKVIANNKAPVDHSPSAPSPLDYGNDYRDPTPSSLSPPQQRPGSTQTPSAPEEKGKKKTSSLPLAGPTNKKQKRVENKIGPKKKLAYELTQEELDEEVDREVKDHFKPKVPEKRVLVEPQIAAKVYSCLNYPPGPTKLPSDFDRTLIKAQQQRKNKKCGKTVPQLGSVQKQLEPLVVGRQPNEQETEFFHETRFMLDQPAGTADIPIAIVVAHPFKLGKLLVTEEEEIKLGTQMFNIHRWYMRMSNEEMDMFRVKYRDHDFYRGEDDFAVYFELLHHIYHRQALDVSIITIWVL